MKDNCWLFAGSLNSSGYGRLSHNLYAHRVMWEHYNAQAIPKGLEIDHLCNVRHCINPEHLELVTRRENIMRSNGVASIQAKKTHCIRGHEFTAENTYVYKGKYRRCITCIRAYDAARVK